MPCIHAHLLPGATLAQKRELVADFTTALVRILGKSPEHIHIVLHEVARTNWGFAGALTSDLAERSKAAAQRSRDKSSKPTRLASPRT